MDTATRLAQVIQNKKATLEIMQAYPERVIAEKLDLLDRYRPDNPAAYLKKALDDSGAQVVSSPTPVSRRGFVPKCYYCKRSMDDLVASSESGETVTRGSATVTYPRCQACGELQPYCI